MPIINLKEYEVWFITGSQDLYGKEILKKVAEHSAVVAASFAAAKQISNEAKWSCAFLLNLCNLVSCFTDLLRRCKLSLRCLLRNSLFSFLSAFFDALPSIFS